MNSITHTSTGNNSGTYKPLFNMNNDSKKSLRGFASMDPERQKAIARKGGETVARNRQHMADIGQKGGIAVSQKPGHMSAIGRKGGKSSQAIQRNNKK